MMMPKPFDAATVTLEGSNLIEASAGTGKTYSIAILVVRLILEKELPVKDILMVTFTKAAVAELEERIRLFVRLAYKSSCNEKIENDTIEELVNAYPDREKAKNLLYHAVLFLDETSVLTIHSFCQKTLNEFAFETNQLFGASTMQDTGTVIEEEVNKFWRKNITTLPAALLKLLLPEGLSIGNIMEVVKQQLDGKKYFTYDPLTNRQLTEDEHLIIIVELNELQHNESEARDCLLKYISANAEHLKKVSAANRYGKQKPLQLIDEPEEFLKYIVKNRKPGSYIEDLYGEILAQHDACEDMLEERIAKIREVLDNISCNAISDAIIGIQGYKQRNNMMSFDDMIVKLHEALMGSYSKRLVSELQKKYKAIFVDEFQDTDRLQYEIFQTAFGKNSILFYIGDPKQSIYAWRKADIFTYFKAYNDVDKIHDMNENHRSSVSLINAMNSFFKPNEGFDTFAFNGAANAINYIKVASPAINKKGHMLEKKNKVVPITITEQPNKESIAGAVISQVIELLENSSFSIPGKDGKQRPISPSDIGILVRSNDQGKNIRAGLSQFGIPAVTIGDEKILESNEASLLLYLLEAIDDISRANINKALLSAFTGFTVGDIILLNDEKSVALFKKYKSLWDEDGIYAAIMAFVADFNVQSVLLQNNTELGERVITNLFHLTELLHRTQAAKKLSGPELISWLKRANEGMETEGDEYEQRVENDEESIKIVTIHKSKGLEYNIVLAPYLDFVEHVPKGNADPVKSFRDANSGDYIAIKDSRMNPEQKQLCAEQSKQENRRLLYVAITRAVYTCFIYRNVSSRAQKSTLADFLNAAGNTDPNLISHIEPLPEPENYRYSKRNIWEPIKELKDVRFLLTGENWIKLSYSKLAHRHETTAMGIAANQTDAYDQFIFKQLTRGRQTGNMLHTIFENIHFNNPEKWAGIIDNAIIRFAPAQKELYQQPINKLIEHVLQAEIKINGSVFKLAEIDYRKRIHEFEFDFPVSLFTASELESLSDEKINVHINSTDEMEGIMNGKLDMFFEHDGKYYILDWKSNYLGNNLDNYTSEALANKMNDQNFHLQYLIYTLAVKKYLETRLPGFEYERDFGGVIYVFMRGVRRGKDTGFYVTKPSEGKINLLEEKLHFKG